MSTLQPRAAGLSGVVLHPWFRWGTLALVVANVCFLCATNPLDADGYQTRVVNFSSLVFSALFAVELLLKLLAGGPIAFLADPWNWVECTLVALSYAFYFSPSGALFPNLNSLRIARLIAIAASHPYISPSVVALRSAEKGLLAALLFGFLYLLVFSFLGLELWMGVMAGRCADSIGGTLTPFSCAPGCGTFPSDTPCATAYGESCDASRLHLPDGFDGVCVRGPNPDFGSTSFDNIGVALLTSFTLVVEEGWVDTMYNLWNTWGVKPLVSILFVFHRLFGQWAILQLALAVIVVAFSSAHGAHSGEHGSEGGAHGSGHHDGERHGNNAHSAEHHGGEHHSDAHGGEHHGGEHHGGEHHGGEHHGDAHNGEHNGGEHHGGEHHSDAHGGEHHGGEHHGGEHHGGEHHGDAHNGEHNGGEHHGDAHSGEHHGCEHHGNAHIGEHHGGEHHSDAHSGEHHGDAHNGEHHGGEHHGDAHSGEHHGGEHHGNAHIGEHHGGEHHGDAHSGEHHGGEHHGDAHNGEHHGGEHHGDAHGGEHHGDAHGGEHLGNERHGRSNTGFVIESESLHDANLPASPIVVEAANPLGSPTVSDAKGHDAAAVLSPLPHSLIVSEISVSLPQSVPLSTVSECARSMSGVKSVTSMDAPCVTVHNDTVSASLAPPTCVQQSLHLFLTHPVASLFMIAVALANAIVLALPYSGMPADFGHNLDICNYLFVAIFVVELLLRIVADGPCDFFRTKGNVFDFLIVAASAADAVSSLSLTSYNTTGISTLRILRFLRVLRLLKPVSHLLDVLAAMAPAFAAVSGFLVAVIFMFAIVGMQAFGGAYSPAVAAGILDDTPKFNFNTLWLSLVTVFQLICTEDWKETFTAHLAAFGPASVLFFVPAILFGRCIFLGVMLGVVLHQLEHGIHHAISGHGGHGHGDHSHEVPSPQSSQNTGANSMLQMASTLLRQSWEAFLLALHEYSGAKDTRKSPHGGHDEDAIELSGQHKYEKHSEVVGIRVSHAAHSGSGHSPDIINRRSPVSHEANSAHPAHSLSSSQASVTATAPTHNSSSNSPAPSTLMEFQAHDNGMLKGVSVAATGDGGANVRISVSANGSIQVQHLTSSFLNRHPSPRSLMSIAESDLSALPSWLNSAVGACVSIQDEDVPLLSMLNHLIVGYTHANSAKADTLTSNPASPTHCSPCYVTWLRLRYAVARVLCSALFGWLSLAVILLSSVNLALDEPGISSGLQTYLDGADIFVTAFFAVELTAGLIARGILFDGPSSYFQSGWRTLDAFVVCVSIASLALNSRTVKSLRAIRALRALRVLRAIGRFPTLRLAVDAMLMALPRTRHFALLLSLVMIIFAILGLQAFSGAAFGCNDTDPTIASLGAAACSGTFNATGSQCNFFPTDDLVAACSSSPWGAPFPRVWTSSNVPNFDTFGNALLTTWELMTGVNWSALTVLGLSSVGDNKPQVLYANPSAALFYVATFFILHQVLLDLLIGLIVTIYFELRDSASKVSLLTPAQRVWVANIRLILTSRLPTLVIPPTSKYRPVAIVRRAAFYVATSSMFDAFIVFCIIANMVFLALRHVGQSAASTVTQTVSSAVFTAIFAAEACIKIVGTGPFTYWKSWNNRFDFLLVLGSIAGTIADSGTVGSLLRVFRILRVMRMLRHSKTLTQMLNALILSMPGFLNVLVVVAVCLFIFAVIGMNLFAGIATGSGQYLDENANFNSFGASVITLIRCFTGETFNGIMHDLTVQPPYCIPGDSGNCGVSLATSALFFVVFYTVIALVFLNFLVALLLEGYKSANTDPDSGVLRVSHEQVKEFTKVWRSFDVGGELMLPVTVAAEVMARVPRPLGTFVEPAAGVDAAAAAAECRAAAERSLAALALEPVFSDADEHVPCVQFQVLLEALTSSASSRPPLPGAVSTVSVSRPARRSKRPSMVSPPRRPSLVPAGPAGPQITAVAAK